MLLSISSTREAAIVQSHTETLLLTLLYKGPKKTDTFLFPAVNVSGVKRRSSRELPVISNMDLKNEIHTDADLPETAGKQRG